MIGTDDWLPSDTAFEVFIATTTREQLTGFEAALYDWQQSQRFFAFNYRPEAHRGITQP